MTNNFFTFEHADENESSGIPVSKETVIEKTSKQVYWWLGERENKLKSMNHNNMSVNPMLMPIVMGLHDMKTLGEFAKFIVSAHLMQSYSTGYGKLVDEKILPSVFGTKKLNKKFRKSHGGIYKLSCFDEIDHLIARKNGTFDFLSLKASKWTLQLTASVQMNSSFYQIKKLSDEHKIRLNKIYIGVFYGKEINLTDKYDIVRGINRGANHNVEDIRNFVSVKSGKDFWAWINNGEESTQEWICAGQQLGVEKFKRTRGTNFAELVDNYEKSFISHSKNFLDESGQISVSNILKKING